MRTYIWHSSAFKTLQGSASLKLLQQKNKNSSNMYVNITHYLENIFNSTG